MRRLVLLSLVACSSSTPPPPPSPPTSIQHVERCPGVRALWQGERAGGYDHYTRLTLELDGAARPWTTGLEEHADHPFDIFSPDCRHVLLLQGPNGPYHIVRVDRLAAYVAGGKPDHELAGEPDPDGVTGTGVFRGGGWISSTEVSYLWGCCEPPFLTRFKLSGERSTLAGPPSDESRARK
jgi:hypothetical protein